MSETEFDFEVIATGSFLDGDPAFLGKVYRVETVMIRLNPVALNDYCDAAMHRGHRGVQQLLAFKEKIAAALGFDRDKGSFAVRQIQTEVFGVVYITEEKGGVV